MVLRPRPAPTPSTHDRRPSSHNPATNPPPSTHDRRPSSHNPATDPPTGHRDRQRETARQTDTDRQTDRQTEGPTDRQAERPIIRYCSQNQCQKETKPMKCSERRFTKRRGEFDDRNKSHKYDRCHSCMYPACGRCEAVATKPVQPRHKTNKKWICPGCRD